MTTGDAPVGEWLAGVPWGDITPWSLMGAMFLAMLAGKIPNQRQLDDAREDAKAWRTSAEAQREINTELKSILLELLSLARTSDHALREIQLLGGRVHTDREARE